MAKQDRDECNKFAQRVQDIAALKLYELGFKVKQNDVNDGTNDFDLLAQRNGTTYKFEVKGARLHFRKWRGDMRFQARIHNHNADYILLYCEVEPPDRDQLEGLGTWFVIPSSVVWPRPNIAIWSSDPTKTTGQWQPYLERWEVL